jgi:hypothetical protein
VLSVARAGRAASHPLRAIRKIADAVFVQLSLLSKELDGEVAIRRVTGRSVRSSRSSDRSYDTTFVVFVSVLLFRFGSAGDAAPPRLC